MNIADLRDHASEMLTEFAADLDQFDEQCFGRHAIEPDFCGWPRPR